MLCSFLLYSRLSQLHIYIYPLFFRFFSHIGHYRVLSRVPCAIQQVLVSYLFYVKQCVYVSPDLPIYPSPPPSLLDISAPRTSASCHQISEVTVFLPGWPPDTHRYKFSYIYPGQLNPLSPIISPPQLELCYSFLFQGAAGESPQMEQIQATVDLK